MKNTLSRVSFIVHENQKFQVSDRLLCTISGGQDSTLNLILLYHLEGFYFFRINLAYCNHLWHPTNFYMIFELLKFSYLINKPITNVVPKQILLSEEESHLWRQKTFYQLGTYLKLNNIILGHSLSDQIETTFWHFTRGSGPNGLTSLKQNSFITNKNFKKILAQSPLDLQLHCQGAKALALNGQIHTDLLRRSQGYSNPKSFGYKKEIKFLGANTDQKKYFFKINLETYTFQRVKDELWRGNQCSQQVLGMNLRKARLISKFNTEPYQYIYLLGQLKKSRIKLRRPLLCFSRTTISELVKQNQLPRIIDTTNQSKKLIRNKLRLIILPLLNYSLDIKFQRNITKYLNIVEEEQTYFSILEKNLMKFYFKNPVKIKYLHGVPLAIKRCIVKTILEHYISNQVILNYIMNIINIKE